MKQRITIDDVARAAGVSKQTVSRAINDKREISSDTKARIMEIVDELGYRPNRLAVAMNTQRTFTIGLVVPDITNPFFPELARGVQDAAFEYGYNVFVCNSDDDPELQSSILESLLAQGVDGIITFSHQTHETELRSFADRFRPIVLINRQIDHPSIDYLMVENMQGAEMAVGYFIEQGHTQIGMLTNRDFSGSEVRRVQGYRAMMQKHQLSILPTQIVAERATLQGGYLAAKQLLEAVPQTTAIFAYNDLMGIGAIRACRDLGRKVPDDVSIIGFDDIRLASMFTPSLSTVRVDKYALGQNALKRVISLIEDKEPDFPLLGMKVELVLRESTQKI